MTGSFALTLLMTPLPNHSLFTLSLVKPFKTSFDLNGHMHFNNRNLLLLVPHLAAST